MNPALELLEPARLGRVVQRRVNSRAYPMVFRTRSRLSKYDPQARAEQFYKRAEELGHGDLRRYYWYHTIDLAQGLVTPGTYDYRRSVSAFPFPADMSGMKALDVGSATGFFAFELERRGANVTSADLPSVDGFDKFPLEDGRQTIEKLAFMAREHTGQQNGYSGNEGAEDAYEYHVDGPFKFCHRVLGSKVERRYSTIYNLSKDTLGADDFDFVYVGDVIVHTLHPVEALAALASVCSGTLVLSQEVPESLGSQPAIRYVGGETLGEENMRWWLPNVPCIQQILKKLGFKEVEVVGRNRGVTTPGGVYFDRPIIQAKKRP
jgi:tRNA (mo5U34)-methyltransferase